MSETSKSGVYAGECGASWVRAAALAVAAALSLGGVARAGADYLPRPDALSLSPSVDRSSTSATGVRSDDAAVTADGTSSVRDALYLDDAPAPTEQPNIHGFFSSPFKTAYVTPRGLVVENEGLVWQPVVGLVLPLFDVGPIKNLAFVGGIWNSVNTHQQDPYVGAWNEMDVFASLSGTVANNFSLTLTYSPWNSPSHAFHTEHNMDLKIGYDDSKAWGNSGFSLNPYVDLWWAIGGDSTVILGRRGGTGYFEPGIVPTFTFKGMHDYPLTFTFPIYTQVGPNNYWDANGTYTNNIFGLVSVSANVSVPLGFIPVRYGHWHADAGVTYDHLLNSALLHAGTLASGNTNRNVVVGSVGFGVNF